MRVRAVSWASGCQSSNPPPPLHFFSVRLALLGCTAGFHFGGCRLLSPPTPPVRCRVGRCPAIAAPAQHLSQAAASCQPAAPQRYIKAVNAGAAGHGVPISRNTSRQSRATKATPPAQRMRSRNRACSGRRRPAWAFTSTTKKRPHPFLPFPSVPIRSLKPWNEWMGRGDLLPLPSVPSVPVLRGTDETGTDETGRSNVCIAWLQGLRRRFLGNGWNHLFSPGCRHGQLVRRDGLATQNGFMLFGGQVHKV